MGSRFQNGFSVERHRTHVIMTYVCSDVFRMQMMQSCGELELGGWGGAGVALRACGAHPRLLVLVLLVLLASCCFLTTLLDADAVYTCVLQPIGPCDEAVAAVVAAAETVVAGFGSVVTVVADTALFQNGTHVGVWSVVHILALGVICTQSLAIPAQ
jgi:hypothetical protein